MSDNQVPAYRWVLALILVAGLVRLLPHPPNMTPIGAMALFSGAYIGRHWHWLVPVAALVVSDWLIGWYAPIVMAGVYIGFILSSLIGRWLLWRQVRWARITGAIGIAALCFWCISNGAIWLAEGPLTAARFWTTYVDALPFLGLSLVGDLFYGLVLFGIFQVRHGHLQINEMSAQAVFNQR